MSPAGAGSLVATALAGLALRRRGIVEAMTDPTEALAERLFRDAAGALELYTIYLGERLGLYRALHEGGPATSGELAARTGTNERYVREWLEHHAASGLLEVDVATDPLARRFSLPAAHVPQWRSRAACRRTTCAPDTEQHSPKSKLPLPWQLCSGYADGRPWAYLGMSAQAHFNTTDPEAHLALNHWTSPNSITLIDFGIASMSKSWTIVIVGRCGRDGVPMCSPESRYEAPDRL